MVRFGLDVILSLLPSLWCDLLASVVVSLRVGVVLGSTQ